MKFKFVSIVLIAMTSFLTVTATSNEPTVLAANALELLNSKWQVNRASKTAKAPGEKTSVKLLKISDKAEAVNVVSNGHRGFVLYSDAEEDAAMIGYGLEDTLDIRKLPPEASHFISLYAKATSSRTAIKPTSQSGNTYPLPCIAPVEPFIKTKWGQGEPFNGKCPRYEGKPSVTGCVATALGQILHYYRAENFNDYTLEYSDLKSQEEVSINFRNLHFDYANMPDEYVEGNYTQAQADAVAEMMYATGASAKMQWSDTKSSGQWPLVSLDKYFNINATFLIRKKLPTGYWMKKIQDNLASGKPILYTGAGVSNSQWSQHIFIIDGIDENNYVHVNWGWAGQADGYYDITFCHPDIFAPEEDGYYTDQKMICDVAPRAEGEKYAERFICTSGTPIYDLNNAHDTLEGKVTGYTTNSYESMTDYTAKIVAVKGNSIMPLGDSDHYYLKQFPEWGYINWKARSNPNNLPDRPDDGEYELMIATYKYETDELISYEALPMRPYFVIAEGLFTERAYKDFPEGKSSWQDESEYLSFDEFVPLTDVISKAPFVARIKTHSLITAIDSKDIDSIDLCFTNTETGKKYVTTASIDMYDLNYSGLYYEGYAMIEPPTNRENNFMMPAGKYKLSAFDSSADDETDSRVIFPDPIYINVAPPADYAVLRYDIDGTLMLSSWNSTYYTKRWDERLQICRNTNYKVLTTSNNCYKAVKINVYARHPEEDKSKEILLSTFDYDPTAGLDGLTIELPGNLYPLEGEYIFYMRYLTPDGEKNILPKNNAILLNRVREKYEFMSKPTVHNIVANPNAVLPMLETSEAGLYSNIFSFRIRNIGTTDFKGNVIVKMSDQRNGNIAEYIAENVSLAPDAQKTLSVEVVAAPECIYETYILSQSTVSARSASGDYTLATKEDGSVAHYRLGAESGTGGIISAGHDISVIASEGSIVISSSDDTDRAEIYGTDGKLILSTVQKVIPGLPRGIYIVKVKGLAFKVSL